ncbi:hypothetical protein ACF0H5_012792 [Mactra antiquata]
MRPTFLWEYQFSWQILIVNILVTIISVFGYRDHQDHYPRPKFIQLQTNFTFRRGDTAKLSCGVMDLGTKTVVWRRNATLEPLAIGEMIFESSTGYEVHHPKGSRYWDLLIKNVQPEHADIYECQVTTKDKMKKIVQLNVIDDKQLSESVIDITGLDHVDKGHSIKLRCNATGASTPPDGIDWFKDGIPLQTSNNARVSISKHFILSARTMSSELEIKNAQMFDAGMYTCRTSDSQVTSVQVTILNAGKPKPPPEKAISEREVGGPDGGQLQEQNMAGYNSSGSSSFLGNNSLKYLNTAMFVAACLLLLFQKRR